MGWWCACVKTATLLRRIHRVRTGAVCDNTMPVQPRGVSHSGVLAGVSHDASARHEQQQRLGCGELGGRESDGARGRSDEDGGDEEDAERSHDGSVEGGGNGAFLSACGCDVAAAAACCGAAARRWLLVRGRRWWVSGGSKLDRCAGETGGHWP